MVQEPHRLSQSLKQLIRFVELADQAVMTLSERVTAIEKRLSILETIVYRDTKDVLKSRQSLQSRNPP